MKAFSAIVSVIIGLVFLWWIFFYIGWYFGYSEGERTVDVYKFSFKGLIWKSWEGEGYIGGVHSTGGDSPRLEMDRFYFSIESDDFAEKREIIETLKLCAQERKICTIQYKQWFKRPIYVGSSYEVIGVIKN